jgi:hypothetical protein
MQLDTKIKRKQNQVEKSLAIIYPKCTKNHARNECPLNTMEICGICAIKNKISQCPSLSSLMLCAKELKTICNIYSSLIKGGKVHRDNFHKVSFMHILNL